MPGITNSREVIKWMYDDDSRVGDVRRFTLNDGYIVAKIIEFNKTRLPNIEDVRTEITEILIQSKKYDFLKNKYQSELNIDIIAEENNLEFENASAVTQYDPILVGAGVEPYIIGSSFSLEPNELSPLLKGNNGVYIIRLLSKEIAEEINLSQEISNSFSDREKERLSILIPEVLESKAEIIDNRSIYY